MSNKEFLRSKIKIKNTPWGGHKLIYGTREYSMSYKFDKLTEEDAARIIEIMEINKPKPQPVLTGLPCECGCGSNARKGRKFIQGHDMKLKSKLMKKMKKGDKKAGAELEERMWLP